MARTPPAQPPVPTLVAGDLVLDAGAGVARLILTLSAPASGAVSVDWATRDGTATNGPDYTAATGTVTFAPGATRAQVVVALVDDALPEALDRFQVVLSGASGATIANGAGVVSIRGSDAEPPEASPGDRPVLARATSGRGAATQITLAAIAPGAAAAVRRWAISSDAAAITSVYGSGLTGPEGAADALGWNSPLDAGTAIEARVLPSVGSLDLTAWISLAELALA